MTDWTDLEAIRAEWPISDLNADDDLVSWQEGNRLYEGRDDYESMIQAGGLLCRSIRHELYGPGILSMQVVPETTHRVLFSSAFPPPDGQTFTRQAAAQVRLALTVVKKHGWQSEACGGDGAMEKFLHASHMILTTAVAPSPERPWEGDLTAFFTSRPIEINALHTAQNGQSGSGTDEVLDAALADLQQTLMDADKGDPASQARARAIAAAMQGDEATALEHFEAAAQAGDVQSMFEAASTAEKLGRPSQARYWLETAAAAGDSRAMFNLGLQAHAVRDVESAKAWLGRAAAAGNVESYAALTQVADETGDAPGELHWSRLGAQGGHPFCMLRHGQLLMQSHPQDGEVIRNQAIPLLAGAAERGETAGLFLVGVAYGQLGDRSSARLWLARAEEAGDPDATRVLNEHGLR